MRILIMILALANFAFFAWQNWHADDVAGSPPVRTDTDPGKGLALVGERPASVSTPETERPVAPAAQEPSPPVQVSPDDEARSEPAIAGSCATLGPFETPGMAEVAMGRLAELGLGPVMRESGGQIRSGFWVYLPPFESRNAAKEVETELRARGVRDMFIVTESEQRNAISLGLYSTPERADQRAAEIGRLGFTPRVAERFRDATVYWVDFRERADQPLEPEAIGVMGAGDTLPEKREIDCAEIAETTSGA